MSIAPLKSFAIAAAVVAPLAGAASAEAQNLLANPGFESPDASETATPPGDKPGTDGFQSFNGAFTTATSPRTGTQAGKAFSFPGSDVAGFFQDFAANPGDMFVGSAYALNPSTDTISPDTVAAVNIEFRNAAGQISFETSRIITGATAPLDQYQFGQVMGTAPTGTTFARFVLITGFFGDEDGNGSTTSGGSVRFDDAFFGVAPTDVPEPAGLAVLGLAGGALLRRRR